MDCDHLLKKNTHYSTAHGLSESTPELKLDTERAFTAQRIMLVDDEQIVLNVVTRILKRSSFTVDGFTDPIEALHTFQQRPYQYDLVITDQTMPEMLGSEMTAQMLQTRPELPVILSSGYSSIIDEHNVHQYGIRHFLAKPILLDGLLNAIDDCLKPQPANVALIH